MKISCDMAMDLIALYNDGAASADSRAAVREHLKGCPSCAHAYRAYAASKKPKAPENVFSGYTVLHRADLTDKYNKIARNLRRSHMLTTAAVLAVVAASLAAGSYATYRLMNEQDEQD